MVLPPASRPRAKTKDLTSALPLHYTMQPNLPKTKKQTILLQANTDSNTNDPNTNNSNTNDSNTDTDNEIQSAFQYMRGQVLMIKDEAAPSAWSLVMCAKNFPSPNAPKRKKMEVLTLIET